MTAPQKPFNWRSLLLTCQQKMTEPPPIEWIQRPALRDTVLARFCVPLALCPSTNRTSRKSPGWVHAKRKSDLLTLMKIQMMASRGRITSAPLIRPQVIAVRFAIGSSDKYCNFAKAAIDNLRVSADSYVEDARGKRHLVKVPRLGFIVDDSPENVDEHQWWEPVKRRVEECVYIEVRV